MDWSPIDFRKELNDEQYAAVTAQPGPSLVLAGAGSGKTRTLTYRVAWLLLEKRVHPNSLLLLTFTNKAAREMIERVVELTGGSQRPFWSGTFHSIGGRILRQYGHHIGLKPNFTILDQGDAESLLNRIIKETDKNFLKEKENPKPKVIHSLISFSRNTRLNLADLLDERFPYEEKIHQPILQFAQKYQQEKMKQQVVDYDDMLVYWLDLLKNHPDVQQTLSHRFPWVLVDEYQDTNTLQSEIVDRIGSHHNVMAVGDDAQCIYTWRGANYENIRAFPERHPDTRIYKILTNYRSTPQILNLANSVLAAQPAGSGYAKELIANRADSILPFVVPLMDTQQQAQFIVSRIEYLYQQGYQLSDIAVLYRAHFQALDVQLLLTRSNIPFVITSGLRFFELAHVKDFTSQLRAVANPSDLSSLERLLALLPRIGPVTIRKIISAAEKTSNSRETERLQNSNDLFAIDRTAPWTVIDVLMDDAVLGKVPADARDEFVSMATTLSELKAKIDLSDSSQPPPTPADIIEHALQGWYCDYIRNVYPDWQSRRDDLDSLVEFADRFSTLSEFLAQLVLLSSETSEKSIDLDNQSVRLSTIHQAKGLEFPIVFVISCAEDLFPLRRTIETGDVEEERRLFYVAVTRARDELYLSFPIISSARSGGSMRLMPSRFIQEIPPSRYEKLNVRSSHW